VTVGLEWPIWSRGGGVVAAAAGHPPLLGRGDERAGLTAAVPAAKDGKSRRRSCQGLPISFRFILRARLFPRLLPGLLTLLPGLLSGLLYLGPLFLASRLLNLLLGLLPRLLNLRLSPQFLPLLLISPDLWPLLILLLSLTPQVLPLLLRARPIVLDAPGSSPFPVPVVMPTPPVLLKSLVRNPFILPAVSIPITVSVVPSPARVYIKVKTRNTVVIKPTPVIMA
jgi:hypothetical protein